MKDADESAFRKRMGKHMRALRLARELTQVRFAELCDLSPDTVRRIELGMFSPSVTTLRAVMGGFGISLGAFFDSLESGERLVEREITDLLTGRSPDERLMVLRVLQALFGSDERGCDSGEESVSTETVEQRGPVVAEQRREPGTDGVDDPREHVQEEMASSCVVDTSTPNDPND